jgi:hypothetical protein
MVTSIGPAKRNVKGELQAFYAGNSSYSTYATEGANGTHLP